MRKIIIAAATLATVAALASPADAKSWQWQALDVAGGSVKQLATGQDCNLARAISQARKAGATATAAAFTVTGKDDPVACPAKAKKAAATPTAG